MNESVIKEIQALQRMAVGQLRVEWERLYGEPTRSRNRVYLWRRLAWRTQELQSGGLSDVAKARIEELNREGGFVRAQLPRGFDPEAVAAPRPRRDPRLPGPGSTLIRRYKGRDIRVGVGEAYFEWNGRRFDSLSEVAYAVTGARWNGWLFFGLTKRARGR